MQALYLVAELAGQRVAISSSSVDSVVHVTNVVPVPLVHAHVLGLAALRSRVVTMIDCRVALDLEPAPSATVLVTVVVDIEGHHYGLVVDRVDDVCDIRGTPVATRSPLGNGWTRAGRGMLEDEGGSLLLLDPAALIAPAVAAAA